MIKNLYPDPSEVFDTILEDKMILERAASVTAAYDDFINFAHKYQLGLETDTKTLKRKLWRALINVNILEGIRFYASFACTFAFGELRLMEGSAKIISFIARDESQHLAITQHIIKNYRANENDKEQTKDAHHTLRLLPTERTSAEATMWHLSLTRQKQLCGTYLCH